LGTTGGSFDRFKCIPGFEAPKQGEETKDLIKKYGVALSIAGGKFNEFDRRVYLLRSATGTVKAYPLIIASIASKHLALPIHHLLMDFPYGDGTNIRDEHEARKVGEGLKKAVEDEMTCEYLIRENKEPTGASLGPAMEMVESIAVMKYDSLGGLFDMRGIDIQLGIVCKQFAHLLKIAFPQENKSEEEWAQISEKKFKDGSVLKSIHELSS